jgi:hypothetical protein
MKLLYNLFVLQFYETKNKYNIRFFRNTIFVNLIELYNKKIGKYIVRKDENCSKLCLRKRIVRINSIY